MGCSVCMSKSSRRVASKRLSIKVEEPVQDCVYTIELIKLWQSKIKCVKESGLYESIGYSKHSINIALGNINSAINSNDACFFKKQLDKVNDIILALINFGVC